MPISELESWFIGALAEASSARHGLKLLGEAERDFEKDNQSRKKDPFKPAMRGKGEKARNRRNRAPR